jgi:phospholipase C
MKIYFGNTGRSAAVFQVRSGDGQSGPWTYTVGSQAYLSDTWTFGGDGPSTYDLSVYGPNGFLRALRGSVSGPDSANLAVISAYERSSERPGITLDIHNRGAEVAKVKISDAYGTRPVNASIQPGRSLLWHWSLESSFGWYDLTIEVPSDPTFKRQLAGHVETGFDSASDPALGA